MAAEATIKITIDSSNANKSLDVLQGEIKQTRLELDKAIKTFGENSKQADNFRKTLAGLEIEMSKVDKSTLGAINSQSSLKKQLRDTINELNGLEPGSARFVELSAKAGQLRDTIQDTNATVNALAGNAGEKLGKALGSVTQIGVAGFQGVYSTMTLLGGESEDLQKTMAKLMAVMNIAQSIQSFSQMGDTFTNLKATVLALIPGLTGAAGATGALGTAMAALPLVGIVAAIGAVVYGLYQYSQQTDEAAKAEEKRVAKLKEIKKAQDEERKGIFDAGKGYFVLINQLRATNKGSERRNELIKEINGTYGTTLKNLGDENAFQEQLNASVKDYIALSYNRLKLSKNAVYASYQEQKMFEGEQKINQARAEAQDLVNAGIRKNIGDALSYRQDLREQIAEGKKMMADSQAALEKLTKRREELIQQGKDLAETITNPDGDGDKGKKPPLKDKTDDTEKYTEALALLQAQLQRTNEFENQRQKILEGRTNDPFQKQLESTINFYENEQQQVIDRAIKMELEKLDKKFEDGKIKEEEYNKQRELITTNALNYMTAQEKEFYNQLDVFREGDIENLVNAENLKEQLITNKTQEILATTRLMELQYQKERELEDIETAGKTEEKINEEKLRIKRKYAQQEIDLINNLAKEQKDALDLQLKQTLADDEKTANEKKQAQEQYAQDVIKLSQDTADKIDDINQGITQPIPTKDEQIYSAVTKASEYVDKIAELWGQFSNLVGQAQEQQLERRQERLDFAFETESQKLQDQLDAELITREQYEAEIDRLEADKAQKEKEMRKKAFEQQKRAQIVNATIQGTQAVLSAYASGVATPLIGPATAAIYAAIAGAFAATQIGIIANQQFTAAKGGIVPGTGSGDVDSVPSLLAPGEFVINSKSSKMFGGLLSQINEAGGGKKLVPDFPTTTSNQITPSVFNQSPSNQPIRAYVVETDVSDVQRRVNRIKQSVEF